MAMNFNVESKTSSFDVNKAYTDIYNNRASNQDTTRVDSPSRGLFGDDVIGLNASKIPEMKSAIMDMCNAIDAKLNELETDIDSNSAYRGEGIDAAIKNYLGRVAEYCSNLTSTLRAFNDKLTDVKNQWDAATGSMESQIGSTSGSFATGTQYQETLQ